VDEAQATALEFGARFSNLTVWMRSINGAESEQGDKQAMQGHTLDLMSRTESFSATWSTKSWTPSVKRTISSRGGIGPRLLNTSSGMGAARCLPLAFSLRGCICCKLSQVRVVVLHNAYSPPPNSSTADAKLQTTFHFNKFICRMHHFSPPSSKTTPGLNAMSFQVEGFLINAECRWVCLTSGGHGVGWLQPQYQM